MELAPGFDPSLLTVNELVSALSKYNVQLPAARQKKDFYVNLFRTNVTARVKDILKAKSQIKPSGAGVVHVADDGSESVQRPDGTLAPKPSRRATRAGPGTSTTSSAATSSGATSEPEEAPTIAARLRKTPRKSRSGTNSNSENSENSGGEQDFYVGSFTNKLAQLSSPRGPTAPFAQLRDVQNTAVKKAPTLAEKMLLEHPTSPSPSPSPPGALLTTSLLAVRPRPKPAPLGTRSENSAEKRSSAAAPGVPRVSASIAAPEKSAPSQQPQLLNPVPRRKSASVLKAVSASESTDPSPPTTVDSPVLRTTAPGVPRPRSPSAPAPTRIRTITTSRPASPFSDDNPFQDDKPVDEQADEEERARRRRRSSVGLPGGARGRSGSRASVGGQGARGRSRSRPSLVQPEAEAEVEVEVVNEAPVVDAVASVPKVAPRPRRTEWSGPDPAVEWEPAQSDTPLEILRVERQRHEDDVKAAPAQKMPRYGGVLAFLCVLVVLARIALAVHPDTVEGVKAYAAKYVPEECWDGSCVPRWTMPDLSGVKSGMDAARARWTQTVVSSVGKIKMPEVDWQSAVSGLVSVSPIDVDKVVSALPRPSLANLKDAWTAGVSHLPSLDTIQKVTTDAKNRVVSLINYLREELRGQMGAAVLTLTKLGEELREPIASAQAGAVITWTTALKHIRNLIEVAQTASGNLPEGSTAIILAAVASLLAVLASMYAWKWASTATAQKRVAQLTPRARLAASAAVDVLRAHPGALDAEYLRSKVIAATRGDGPLDDEVWALAGREMKEMGLVEGGDSIGKTWEYVGSDWIVAPVSPVPPVSPRKSFGVGSGKRVL
ncbi:hypothetical protein M427DRAFT_59148 [Gonapodya prolifera JEL478]|uniref:LEM-like domain-containing protein n=1 Tax=Gonapodya prolifera (strain JEL478) TaxID=1344416 RepID=A0A139A7Y9_GONPJ|nr:hypothetical protein M427DRAFT_59148 [Gonapodya prolifera JEL478]|eukprot:KXS12824.1 hypothetical protein M427DRAFT_59148 [Gonapodya prolifera JEL478]